MEDAIQRAARARYGAENDIRAKLDPNTGDLRLWRVLEVVEEVDDYFKQVESRARKSCNPMPRLATSSSIRCRRSNSAASPPRPPSRLSSRRSATPSASASMKNSRTAPSEVITGVVKRVEFGHVVVDLGRAEGVIRRDQQIPREMVRVGDRIRSLIMSVRRETRGPQIFLSRAHPDFMKKLFAQEVPEIYDGIIEIKAAAAIQVTGQDRRHQL